MAALAEQHPAAASASIPPLRGMRSGQWQGGSEHLNFPPVSFDGLWNVSDNVQGHEITLSPKSRARQTIQDAASAAAARRAAMRQQQGRLLQPRYSCAVAGCTFNVIHRMEGRWSGDLFTIPNSNVGVSSSNLLFVSEAGCWVDEAVVTDPSGVSSSKVTTLRPLSDGQLEMIEQQGAGSRTIVREVGPNSIVMTKTDIQSGAILEMETICILDPDTVSERVRTRQIFIPGSVSLYQIIESRRGVIGSESGNMVHVPTPPPFTL